MGFRPKIRGIFEGGKSPDEVMQLLSGDSVLVDVRTLNEYKVGHIPGAKLIDAKAIAENALDSVFATDPFAQPEKTTIVLVCDNGLRSSVLTKQVRSQGLKAEFLAGGLAAWIGSGQYVIPGEPR